MNWYKTSQIGNNLLPLIKMVSKSLSSFGGNCGTFSLGLGKFAQDKGNNVEIILALDDEYELEDLVYGEPTLYHTLISINGTWYDGDGITNINKLKQFCLNEYGDKNPIIVRMKMDENCRKIVHAQTAILYPKMIFITVLFLRLKIRKFQK